ncbi:MAG TPA: hypothetical protein VFI05_08045 [Nitrospiraceae bacterium]|nr:hypothetical protein [Nitrospiraceae bacterium]
MQVQYCKNLDIARVRKKVHSKGEAPEKSTTNVTIQPWKLKWVLLDSLEHERQFVEKTGA